MNCSALDLPPVNIIGGLPTNLSPWCPPGGGACGIGNRFPPCSPLPPGGPPLPGGPLNGPPPGPCPPHGHPKVILGDALCSQLFGGSGWSGPMAWYKATLSGFIGISICLVWGLIVPAGTSMVMVRLMPGSCMCNDSANCSVIICLLPLCGAGDHTCIALASLWVDGVLVCVVGVSSTVSCGVLMQSN
jgi:hypothetical protein